jgi:hypothetical protein
MTEQYRSSDRQGTPMTFKKLYLARVIAVFFGLAVALPAFAGVSVSSPANGASVSSPFNLVAYASACSNQNVASMTYSIDSGSDQGIVYASSINKSVSAGSGGHTVHVKSWGNSGAFCMADVSVTVTGTTSTVTGDVVVPSYAAKVSNLETLSNWVAAHDTGTPGWSSGGMSVVSSPSYSGPSRQFYTQWSNSGGERFHVSFADDVNATNFLFDTWVYIANNASLIGNLEFDLNQVIANGQTVIFGFQCDGYSGTWDYTKNGGSATSSWAAWVHSGAKCNPRSWAMNKWHHVQISYSRDSSGYVTYKAVWLDGAEQAINARVFSGFALGWGPVLLANYQVDGLGGSGSVTSYLDSLTVYRW